MFHFYNGPGIKHHFLVEVPVYYTITRYLLDTKGSKGRSVVLGAAVRRSRN